METPLHFKLRLDRLEALLDDTERAMQFGMSRIERQTEIVATLERAGCDATSAIQFLAVLKRAQHDRIQRGYELVCLIQGLARDVELASASEVALMESRMAVDALAPLLSAIRDRGPPAQSQTEPDARSPTSDFDRQRAELAKPPPPQAAVLAEP